MLIFKEVKANNNKKLKSGNMRVDPGYPSPTSRIRGITVLKKNHTKTFCVSVRKQCTKTI
jgi:hypothetical protein